jgi:small subunit ribosomal protein S17
MIKTKRKLRTGVVISDKMQKTIIVRVTTASKHPKYSKVIKHSASFKAHDEGNTAKIGDTVLIEESRPISKDKRWRLVEVLKKRQVVEDLSLDPLSEPA